jgi:hypothetical protein
MLYETPSAACTEPNHSCRRCTSLGVPFSVSPVVIIHWQLIHCTAYVIHLSWSLGRMLQWLKIFRQSFYRLNLLSDCCLKCHLIVALYGYMGSLLFWTHLKAFLTFAPSSIYVVRYFHWFLGWIMSVKAEYWLTNAFSFVRICYVTVVLSDLSICFMANMGHTPVISTDVWNEVW